MRNRRILIYDSIVQMIINPATPGPATQKFPPLSFPAGLPTSTPFLKSATPQLRHGSEDSMLAAPADVSTSPLLTGKLVPTEQPRGSNGSITAEHFGLVGSGEKAASGSKERQQGDKDSKAAVEGGVGMMLSKLGGTSTNSSGSGDYEFLERGGVLLIPRMTTSLYSGHIWGVAM